MSLNLRSSALRKSTLIGSLMLSAAMAHGTAQAQAYVIDLPRQSLSASLRAYAQTYGEQIIFTEDLVAGKLAPELHGQYSADDALTSLLEGTGLSTRRSPSGAIMIERKTEFAANDAGQPPATAGIETIVITGTKWAGNVQNMTSSVFVASDDGFDNSNTGNFNGLADAAPNANKVIERTNVRDFDDLVNIAPNLTITKTTQPANNSINIRGIGTYAYSIATEASTAVVVDDIPQAFQPEAFQAIFDAAQVAVYRGPQSTSFGKSASAGIISITTKAPSDTFTAGAETMATDDREFRIQGYMSGPLTDTLKFRVALNADSYRGNLYNTYNDTWVLGHADIAAYAKLQWNPADDWQITLSSHWNRTWASCCTWAYYYVSPGVTFGTFGETSYSAPQSAILNGIVPGPNNRRISADVNPKGNAVDYGAGLKIERHIGDYTLTSITGYDHYYLHDLQDTEGTSFNWGPGGAGVAGAIAGGSANGGWFDIGSLTQEIRLTSPASGRLRYVAGMFFNRTESKRDFVRGSNALTQDGTLTTVPANNAPYASYLAHAFNTNMAVFAQATLDIAKDFSFTGGVRINRGQIAYQFWDRFNNVTFGVPRCSTTTPSGLTASTCNRSDTVTGKAALQYHIAPQAMIFASYDYGQKGQAYDLTSTYTQRTVVAGTNTILADSTAASQPIPEETVNAYQIGLKSVLFDSVIFNVTLFDEIFRGLQAQSRDPVLLQNVLNSIEQVTSRGAEMELTAYVSNKFTLNAAGSFNEAVIDSFPNAACFPSQTAPLGCINNQQDLSGKNLFDTPKWKFNINGEYIASLNEAMRGFVNFSYRWQSGVWKSLLHDPASFQEAYGVFNLGAGVESGYWKLTLFCNNLFKQNYALTRGRDTNWNITPYAAIATDAIRWTPARDSSRYTGFRLAVHT